MKTRKKSDIERENQALRVAERAASVCATALLTGDRIDWYECPGHRIGLVSPFAACGGYVIHVASFAEGSDVTEFLLLDDAERMARSALSAHWDAEAAHKYMACVTRAVLLRDELVSRKAVPTVVRELAKQVQGTPVA